LVEKYQPTEQVVKNMIELKFTNKNSREEFESYNETKSEEIKQDSFLLERNSNIIFLINISFK
jgi:hypothetical protein